MAEIMHQRRAEQRGGGDTGRHPRDKTDLNVQLLLINQLQHQPRHAVDAGVAAADQRNVVPGLRQLDGRRQRSISLHMPVLITCLSPVKAFTVGVGLVAHHDLCRLQGLHGFHGHHRLRAGPIPITLNISVLLPK